MRSILWGVAGLFLTASVASAHFVFIIPQPGNDVAKVVMSEELEPDPEVKIELIGGTQLQIASLNGNKQPLTLKNPADHAYTIELPGTGTRVISGVTDLGVNERGKGPAHVLLYYPKTIVGNAFDQNTVVGNLPVELVPEGKPGAVTFKVLINGKPAKVAEVHVLLPDGQTKSDKTNESGVTGTFAQQGRYGAWVRYWETKAGERDGKKYEQVRHYATLVVDVK